MRHSIELRCRIYVTGYGFLSFAKNIGTYATKFVKNMSNKYSQKFLGAKKSTTDAIKIASKRAIQKTAEATGDLIGNKIADKITSTWKYPKEFHSQSTSKEMYSKTNENEIEIPKEGNVSPEKRQQIIDKLRLI